MLPSLWVPLLISSSTFKNLVNNWSHRVLFFLCPQLLGWGVALPFLAAELSRQPLWSLPAWSEQVAQADPQKHKQTLLPSRI